MIACDCPVCTSDDPRDRRTRPCVLVQSAGGSVVIDTPPEFRLQCLANRVTRCDAVLYTHHHVDHVAGLDDLRRFNWIQNAVLPSFGPAATLSRLQAMFPYVFAESDLGFAIPRLNFTAVSGPFDLLGERWTPIPLWHGTMPVFGYRVGGFAYCTDVSRIPDESWPLLEGLELLVLDALRLRPHPTHFNLEQAIEAARRIGAARTCFTHIAHELGHRRTNAILPTSMELAYDGMELSCS